MNGQGFWLKLPDWCRGFAIVKSRTGGVGGGLWGKASVDTLTYFGTHRIWAGASSMPQPSGHWYRGLGVRFEGQF